MGKSRQRWSRNKRILSVLLLLSLCVSSFVIPQSEREVQAASAISLSTYDTKVSAFIADSRWKNNTAWAARTPYISKWSSTGCCAYAADFAAYVYGSTSSAWTGSYFQNILM